MTPRHRRAYLRILHLPLPCTLLFALLVGGCSDDSSGESGLPASASYIGLVAADNGQTGPLELAFATPVAAPPAGEEAGAGPGLASSAPVSVTGTMQLGAAPVANISGVLTDGTFEAQTDGGYALSGTLEQGVLTGDVAGPGALTGLLVAASSSAGSPARAYCGTFQGEDTIAPFTSIAGTFNLVVASGEASGVLYRWYTDFLATPDTSSRSFAGTATASAIKIKETDPSSGAVFTVTGAYDAAGIAGAFNEADTNGAPLLFGTYTGEVCGG